LTKRYNFATISYTGKQVRDETIASH